MLRTAALALLLAAGPAFSQSVGERLIDFVEQIEPLPENNCRPTSAEVTTVINGIIAALPAGQARGSLIATGERSQMIAGADGTGAAVAALGFLERHPMWRADNHDDAVARLRTATAETTETHIREAAARALAYGHGGLVQLIINHPEPEARFDALRTFIADETGSGSNPFLRTIAQLTLSEGLQEEAYGARQTAPAPWTAPDGAGSAEPMLDEAITLYREARSFYASLVDDPTWSARDASLDFDYQIAVLDYVNGGQEWQQILGRIIEAEGNKDHFQPAVSEEGLRHIRVQSFLRLQLQEQAGQRMDSPPDTCAEISATTQASQADPETGIGINRFFNAPLLAHATCTTFENWKAGDVTSLARLLATHANADYRIVVGHYRGDAVRFSFLSRADLRVAADALVKDLLGSGLVELRAGPRPTQTCPWPEQAAQQFSPSLDSGDQPTGEDSGYIYVGNGLTWAEGTRLLEQVTRRRGASGVDFSGAYLLRPVIE